MRLLTFTEFAVVGGKNTHEAVQAQSPNAAIQVTTTEASVITVQRSANGADYSDLPDFSLAVNGLDEFNIINMAPGQYFRVMSTGEMTKVNIVN